MANKKKKTPAKPADESFLTTAAQTIGSTLGQLAVKAGVVSAPAPAVKKPAAKKVAAKKVVAKKKAPAKKPAAKSKK